MSKLAAIYERFKKKDLSIKTPHRSSWSRVRISAHVNETKCILSIRIIFRREHKNIGQNEAFAVHFFVTPDNYVNHLNCYYSPDPPQPRCHAPSWFVLPNETR